MTLDVLYWPARNTTRRDWDYLPCLAASIKTIAPSGQLETLLGETT